MLRLVVLAISLAAWSAAQSTPCGVCKDERSVACPTCKGNRRVRSSCEGCRASGQVACRLCAILVRQYEKDLKEAGIRLGRGMVPCANEACDKKGSVHWELSGVDRCMFCGGKGQVKCAMCGGDSQMACEQCAGKREDLRLCWDCAGSGRVTCPGCAVDPGAACSRCNGALRRVCGICDGNNSGTQPCADCGGTGKVACRNCHGYGRRACRGCYGTGKLRFKSEAGKRAGTNTDPDCKGAGAVTCDECTKGLVGCDRCTKGMTKGCPACAFDGHTFCVSCATGGFLALETSGRLLLEARAYERAATFFKAALDAADRRISGTYRLPRDMTAADARTWWKVLRTIGDALPKRGSDLKPEEVDELRGAIMARIEAQLQRARDAASKAK